MMNNWSKQDPKQCPCQGNGWVEVDLDIWKQCPIHWDEQLPPNSNQIKASRHIFDKAREDNIRYEIRVGQQLIKDLRKQIRQEEENILALQMELIGRIPT
jgi:hypothetical protein